MNNIEISLLTRILLLATVSSYTKPFNILPKTRTEYKCYPLILIIFIYSAHARGLLFHLFYLCGCWRAVPANQAMYALRSTNVGTDILPEGKGKQDVPDELLPRDRLSYTYKFGWCRPDAISKQYLRKTFNLTLPTWQDQQAEYLYFLEDKHTRKFALQCIVMKAYVNRKYLFYKSRPPLYYCQGVVLILLERTVNRFAIHEFYLYYRVGMPVSFSFEFYQPQRL